MLRDRPSPDLELYTDIYACTLFIYMYTSTKRKSASECWHAAFKSQWHLMAARNHAQVHLN